MNFVCMKNWSDYSYRITITLLETSRKAILYGEFTIRRDLVILA